MKAVIYLLEQAKVEGGNKMETNDKTKSEAVSLLLRIVVSIGVTNEHIYSLPNTSEEAKKTMDFLINFISSALAGKIGYLYLEHPRIVYNPEHIVYIEAIFRGPSEWEELMRKSTKPPLGFRPEKPSE